MVVDDRHRGSVTHAIERVVRIACRRAAVAAAALGNGAYVADSVVGMQVVDVSDRRFDAGEVSVTWDGRDTRGYAAAAGTYLFRVSGEDGVVTGKATLVR